MNRWMIWGVGAAILAVVWLMVSGGIGVARLSRPTATKLIAYIEAKPLAEGQSPSERKRRIEEVARQLNRLDFEQRREVQFSRSLNAMQAAMTDIERLHYLDLSMPHGMKQFMEAFNGMPPDRRARHLVKALQEIEAFQKKYPDPAKAPFERELVARIVQEGTTVLLRDASAQSKIELQPLIDQVQHIVQSAR